MKQEEIILMWQATRFERNNIEEFARMVEAKAAERERERLAQEAHECGGVLTVGAILSKG